LGAWGIATSYVRAIKYSDIIGYGYRVSDTASLIKLGWSLESSTMVAQIEGIFVQMHTWID
jgi:xanthine dehydrogenase molybdopterin-binding subunit B